MVSKKYFKDGDTLIMTIFRKEAEVELKIKKIILQMIKDKEEQAKLEYNAFMMERMNLEHDIEYDERKLKEEDERENAKS